MGLMAGGSTEPVISQILTEQGQSQETRQWIYDELEKSLGRPVVALFTSFKFPVSIEDADADMLEGILQKLDLSAGLALIINSPGGDGLAAERMINICRSYSGTGEYWAIVPNKAKSAATMVCLGASKVLMGPSSELGPIDPQWTVSEEGVTKRFSVYNIVQSYEDLFARAIQETGNLQPYLQQLSLYDEREIQEHRGQLALSEDIAARALSSGMMGGMSEDKIKEEIGVFLTPERTKTHGRPIYREEAARCGLEIQSVGAKERFWELAHELYIRTNNYVNTNATKCVETREHGYYAGAGY